MKCSTRTCTRNAQVREPVPLCRVCVVRVVRAFTTVVLGGSEPRVREVRQNHVREEARTTRYLTEEPEVSEPITWTARTVAEAIDLLRAVEERISSGMKAAHPGNTAALLRSSRETELNLRITFDPSVLDQIANERSTFDDQVSPLPLPDQP